MTLGPVLLLLAAFDGISLSKRNPLLVFGKVPLFFFVVHFFLIHLLTIPIAAVRYGSWTFLLRPMPSLGGRAEDYPSAYGYPLWAVYVVWLVVLALMYPACAYIGRLKAEKRSRWLAYI